MVRVSVCKGSRTGAHKNDTTILQKQGDKPIHCDRTTTKAKSRPMFVHQTKKIFVGQKQKDDGSCGGGELQEDNQSVNVVILLLFSIFV